MCNRVDNAGLKLEKVSQLLDAEIAEDNYELNKDVNAFVRPALPIVLEHHGRYITHGTWGVDKEIPKDKPGKGINLTAEKAHTLYKNIEHQRCVVPVRGFYEWMHFTPAGRKTPLKIKHRMTWQGADEFFIAGLYQLWDNKEVGFGLVTTVANELMSVVHNSKKRMPICLDARAADRFLQEGPISDFVFPAYDPKLIAVNQEPEKLPPTLF